MFLKRCVFRGISVSQTHLGFLYFLEKSSKRYLNRSPNYHRGCFSCYDYYMLYNGLAIEFFEGKKKKKGILNDTRKRETVCNMLFSLFQRCFQKVSSIGPNKFVYLIHIADGIICKILAMYCTFSWSEITTIISFFPVLYIVFQVCLSLFHKKFAIYYR